MFTSYLTTRLRELCEWIEYFSGERKDQWRGFKQLLEQLRDTGVQPRQGEVRINKGLSAWWQTHTECFTHDWNVNTHNWGSRTTPEAPEGGRPGSAGCAGCDCGIGGERIQNCIHRRVLKKIEPQGHAHGGWLRCIRNRR